MQRLTTKAPPQDEDVQLGKALRRIGDLLLDGTITLTATQRRSFTALINMPGSRLQAHDTTRDQSSLL